MTTSKKTTIPLKIMIVIIDHQGVFGVLSQYIYKKQRDHVWYVGMNCVRDPE